MSATPEILLPLSINQLSIYKIERFKEILFSLIENNMINGALLGGSCAYKTNLSKSDIDLFCLCENTESTESDLRSYLVTLNEVETVIFQGFYPWTENLYTLYFKQDIDFSIDLCFIPPKNFNLFFWEPTGHILFDKDNLIKETRIRQMSEPNYTQQPFLKLNPFSLSVVTLKKIEKNISRGHLWNAIELLSILRRYVIQIIRLNVLKNNSFLGRVDRDIEDVISQEMNIKLSNTTALYDASSIAQCTVLLIEIIESLQEHLNTGNEREFEPWLMMQLTHEKYKLKKYHAQTRIYKNN